MNLISDTLRRHQLISFYVLTFAISWLCWVPLALFTGGLQLLGNGYHAIDAVFMLQLLGTFGPLLAAFALTYVHDGKKGVARLLKKMSFWRVHVKWYLIALFSIPALAVAAIVVSGRLSGQAISMPLLDNGPLLFLLLPIMLALAILMGGPLGEEAGWRGYALPRLQSATSPLVASIVIGVLWGLWHLPLFYIAGTAQYGLPVAFFVANDIALAAIMTYVYNNTNGSVLLAMLMHAASNIGMSLLPGPSAGGDTLPGLVFLALEWAVMLAIVALGWNAFTNKKELSAAQ